ncbi:hypothetical protein Y032_0025g1197 [Ancylostoma ceylanicum]|uniref:Non-specific protein-tyrosine kinase n=1 Tax=Ancylostoma ceylanicum TaxID=53326 RepID=A0A016UVW1_9BILA|nr:hypothetical protein Y032_0025g1197 [Ancylostoma ceylanicum]
MVEELENEPWYHGALPLEDITALVAVKGDFLIRELEPEGGRGPMPCLTVRLESQMKDYPIHTVQIGNTRMFTIDGVNKGSTVVGIVQKHYQEKISLQDDGVLLKPIPKQPWELSKDKIQLKTKLGEGAFGEVWKGTLRQSPTKTVEAAIKVTKLKEDNKKYMQEMYKEARLMRQYQHMISAGAAFKISQVVLGAIELSAARDHCCQRTGVYPHLSYVPNRTMLLDSMVWLWKMIM